VRNLNLKSNYFISIFTIILLIFLGFWIWNVTNLYNTNLLQNDLMFFFWFLKDTTTYYVFTLFTLFTLFYFISLEKIYVYLSGWLFTQTSKAQSTVTSETVPVAVSSQKYIYYNWLTKTNKDWAETHWTLFDKTNIQSTTTLPSLFSVTNNLALLNTPWSTSSRVDVPTSYIWLKLNFFLNQQTNQFSSSIFDQHHSKE
jgi:hypothetical protein